MKFGKEKKEAPPPAVVVHEARRMLTRRGAWFKGGYKGVSKAGLPTRCLIQAINDAGDGKEATSLTLTVINELYGKNGTIRARATGDYTSIPSFNDAATTTKPDVLRVLDEAYRRGGGKWKEPDVGTMQVMDPKAGDRHIHWDPTRPAEVEDAQASFDFLVKEKGYFAYMVEEVKGKFNAGKQVKTFDPSVGRLILRPALVGG